MTKDQDRQPADDTKRERPRRQASAPEKSNVLDIKEHQSPPIDYNIEEMQDFLDMVFHAQTEEDPGYVLLWKTHSGHPSFPMSEGKFIEELTGARKANICYFATATCVPDDEGNLRNQKKLFSKLHVVVLDDIGTKIPVDKIPADLKPTYIIESSEGNFQYGYVLEDPIDSLELAEALIQLVYESGLTDAGGKMPTKLVRMPCGVNGKKGPKRDFRVHLVETDGPFWTPEAMLKIMDIGVDWKEVVEDPSTVLKKRAIRSAGVTPWSPIKSQASTLNGIVDPVLEWLYENNKVLQETEDWITVKCPWHMDHSPGSGEVAGYSPLGRGDGYEHMRTFSCFHDHCKTRTTMDYLSYIAAEGAPEVPAVDRSGALVSGWVFDVEGNLAWQIKDVEQPRPIRIEAFRNMFPRKVKIATWDGKTKTIPEHTLWLTSPARVSVYGRTFNPETTSRIVSDPYTGDLMVNMFYRPEWGEGDYDKDEVDNFLQFLTYLIPDTFERDYFMEWLAAKAQNMAFRGAAILMIAKQQGTGRGTLADMLGQLFGHMNLETVPFHELTGDGQWNEWMEKPIVVTNETKDIKDTKGFYKAYERLKDLVDPRALDARINPKYGFQRSSKIYTSYLMFSNHDNALAVAGNDRRFFVIRNAATPAAPSYFMDLNKWLQRIDKATRRPVWAKHVWRYLQSWDVDLERLLAPAPTTVAKQAMIQATTSPFTHAVETIVNAMPGDFVAVYKVREILMGLAGRLNMHDFPEPQFKAAVNAITYPIGDSNLKIKIENKVVRPRVKASVIAKPDFDQRILKGFIPDHIVAIMRRDISNVDNGELIRLANETLDLLE